MSDPSEPVKSSKEEIAAKVADTITKAKKVSITSLTDIPNVGFPEPDTSALYRGANYQRAEKFPDWAFWRHMPEVAYWQACALAFNIDPDSLERHPQNWMAPGSDIFTQESFLSNEQYDSFDKLLRLLNAHLSNRKFFTPTHSAAVRLDEFAAWCAHVGFEIPEQLAERAKDKSQAEAVPDISPSGDNKPWLVVNLKDPAPAFPWYTPARYFARKLVKDDSTLLTKKLLLAAKVAKSLADVGFFKRGKIKKLFSVGTVLKSFVNVALD